MKRGTAYGYGRVRKRPNGSFLADLCGCGQRLRRTFRTASQARQWLDAQMAAPCTLTASQLAQAAEAFAMLPPGVSLIEALQRGLEAVTMKPSAYPLHTLADAWLDARARELRPKTLRGYRAVLARAGREMGDTLEAYTPEAITRWVSTMPPPSRNVTIRSLSAFFGWAVSQGYATRNPAAGVKLARTAEPSRAVLTPAQVEHLLRTAAAVDARTVPYFALCAFAGIRPAECMRLRAENIGAQYITLAGAVTKTAAARTVAIRPNLRAILDAYPVADGGVTAGLSAERFTKRAGAVVKATGIAWTQDVLRHSFASYAYEATGDAAATAAEMGHRGTDIFFRHYRGLVPPGSGAEWFSVTL